MWCYEMKFNLNLQQNIEADIKKNIDEVLDDTQHIFTRNKHKNSNFIFYFSDT